MVESYCALRFSVPVPWMSPDARANDPSVAWSSDRDGRRGPVPACWTPSDLSYRTGDERVQRGTTQARIAAPKRTLAEYSSVAPRGAIRRVQLPPGKKLVALTFDLCEQPFETSGYQGGIVDILRSHGIKATFFMGGKWMLSHRERTQQLMADPMFEVANHTGSTETFASCRARRSSTRSGMRNSPTSRSVRSCRPSSALHRGATRSRTNRRHGGSG
jgi:peptidoglycan/xylan/chitin deacetylase (PgdA/CDA1 family)